MKILIEKGGSLPDTHKDMVSKIIDKLEQVQAPFGGNNTNSVYLDKPPADLTRLETNLIFQIYISFSQLRKLASLLIQGFLTVSSTSGVSPTLFLHLLSTVQTFIRVLKELCQDLVTTKKIIELAEKETSPSSISQKKELIFNDEAIQRKIWEAQPILEVEASSGSAKKGTIEQVIKTITEEGSGGNLFKSIIATYQSFTNPHTLLSYLISRLTPPNSSQLDESKIKFIKLKTINVLKHWIKTHFEDFDENFVEIFLNVCEKLSEIDSELAKTLKSTIQQKINSSSFMKPYLPEIDIQIPTIPTSPLDLFNISAEEIARQLTLISFENFKKIVGTELLDQAWSKPHLNYCSPNVISMVKRTDRLASWVATTILMGGQDLKKRVEILTKFIDIAKELYDLQDFNTLMGVIVGLSISSINRLKQTWAALDDTTIEIHEKLHELMSPASSFSNYRNYIKTVNPPCVPFLAVYLSDLTFIEEGNQDQVDQKNEKILNIDKRKMVYEVIEKLQLYQSAGYDANTSATCLKRLEPLYSFLEVLPCWEERDQYTVSLWEECRVEGGEIEKKEKKDKSKSKDKDHMSLRLKRFSKAPKEEDKKEKKEKKSKEEKRDSKKKDEEKELKKKDRVSLKKSKKDKKSEEEGDPVEEPAELNLKTVVFDEFRYNEVYSYIAEHHPGFETTLEYYKVIYNMEVSTKTTTTEDFLNLFKKYFHSTSTLAFEAEKKKIEEAIQNETASFSTFLTNIRPSLQEKLESYITEYSKNPDKKKRPTKQKSSFRIISKV
uniref:Ras-GEF domain-containing protein n=1 Tax=Arcella intermedia TaxID=1963864 RepID=A0A6B2KY23_9EUKA